jgi:hypothetical protein
VLPTTSLTVSRLGERVGARTLSTAGMLSISLVGLSWLGPDASTTAIVWPLVLLGVGGGLFTSVQQQRHPQHHSTRAPQCGQRVPLDGARLSGQLLDAFLGAQQLWPIDWRQPWGCSARWCLLCAGLSFPGPHRWDPSLSQRSATAVGAEAHAYGAPTSAAPSCSPSSGLT